MKVESISYTTEACQQPYTHLYAWTNESVASFFFLDGMLKDSDKSRNSLKGELS